MIIIPHTKNDDPVGIPMTSAVRNTIQQLLQKRKVVSPYVFCDDHGKPFSKNKVSVAFKRAGIEDLRFHDLRHHFASTLVQKRVGLYRCKN